MFKHNDIAEELKTFSPLSLTDIEDLFSSKRVDTKFILEPKQLIQLLPKLCSTYKILDTKGKRVFRYKTHYFDTNNKALFHAHVNGKLNRFKIRYREYLDVGDTYFEIKFKNNKGHLLKYRLDSRPKIQLDQRDRQFIREHTNLDSTQLMPVIINEFSRITFIEKSTNEKITIDLSLHFKINDKQLAIENMIILELKQDKKNRDSVVFQEMKKLGVRESSFSKYITGSILMDDQLKYNNYKPNLRHLIKASELC